MGLLQLNTDLTKLHWGKDTPGGGNSGLPYIKTPLPENSSDAGYILRETAKFSSDFPNRGGLYQVRAAAEDAIRIRKFLTDFPKGSNFTLKQIGLQKSNPLIETGKNGGRINTQTYNLNSNLLFSVLMSGNGEHYPRAGSTIGTLLEDENKYLSIVAKKPTEQNRLYNLYRSKIKGDYDDIESLNKLGISLDNNLLFEYLGGPGSLYGDGETIILRASDNQGVSINTEKPRSFISKYISNPSRELLVNVGPTDFLLDRDSITEDDAGIIDGKIYSNSKFTDKPSESIVNRPKYILGSTTTDFRKGSNSFSRDYTNPRVDIQTRVGIGSPGGRSIESRKNINIEYKAGQDKVNMTPIFYREDSDEIVNDSKDARDLIKFVIEVIDNNKPENTYRSHFRAFITGFSDSNSSNWNSSQYAGRGDRLYSYEGFERKISFKFVVLAQSKQEMKMMWKKLNHLNSTIMPDYSSEGFMRGNIHKLTIGEYLYRMPGIITSLNYTIQDNYPWEIKMDEPENGYDQDMMELPHMIDVSVSFTPIYNEIPRTITIDDYNFGALISNEIGRTENFISKTDSPFNTL